MTQEDGPNWKSTESETARERELWREELRLKERELALKESEHQRSRWTNPLVLAVVAAALAALGNAVVALINGSQQRALEASQRALEETRANNEQVIEETKEEAVRILEVIKAHDDKSVRQNLKFLIEAGLITNDKRRSALQTYLRNTPEDEGPRLPPQTAAVGTGCNVVMDSKTDENSARKSAEEANQKFKQNNVDLHAEPLPPPPGSPYWGVYIGLDVGRVEARRLLKLAAPLNYKFPNAYQTPPGCG